MNYRRGLQRLYLTIAVAWIVAVNLALLSYRWQPWRSALPEWVRQNEALQPSVADPGLAITPETFLHDEATKSIHHRLWAWDGALSILAPLVLYGVIFGTMPWIYRGFKSGTQI